MFQTHVSLPDTGVCRHTGPLPFSKRAFYPPGLPDRGIESPWKSAGISCELDRDTNAAYFTTSYGSDGANVGTCLACTPLVFRVGESSPDSRGAKAGRIVVSISS